MEPFVDDCSAVLKSRLEQYARSGTSIDISHWMQCYAFDVIGKLTVRTAEPPRYETRVFSRSSRSVTGSAFSTAAKTYRA